MANNYVFPDLNPEILGIEEYTNRIRMGDPRNLQPGDRVVTLINGIIRHAVILDVIRVRGNIISMYEIRYDNGMVSMVYWNTVGVSNGDQNVVMNGGKRKKKSKKSRKISKRKTHSRK